MSEGKLMPVHSKGGIYLGHYSCVPVRKKRLFRFLKYVIRGLYWKRFGLRLPDNYVLEVLRINEDYIEQAVHIFCQDGASNTINVAQGVFGCFYLVAEEDIVHTAWLLWFYDSIVYVVATGSKENLQQSLGRSEPNSLAD